MFTSFVYLELEDINVAYLEASELGKKVSSLSILIFDFERDGIY